jgi:hypothetical protein
MATKRAGNDSEAGATKKLQHSKRNKDHVEEDVDPAIESIDNGGDDGATGEEVEESLEKVPKTSKKIRGLDYQMRSKAWKVVMLD